MERICHFPLTKTGIKSEWIELEKGGKCFQLQVEARAQRKKAMEKQDWNWKLTRSEISIVVVPSLRVTTPDE